MARENDGAKFQLDLPSCRSERPLLRNEDNIESNKDNGNKNGNLNQASEAIEVQFAVKESFGSPVQFSF